MKAGGGQDRRHRRLIALRGTEQETEARARALVAALPRDEVLDARTGLRQALGRSVQAVVLDLHGGLDVDALGQAQGLIRGGGALILRLPDAPPPDPRLVVAPFGPEDAGHRLWDRLLARLPAEVAERPLQPAPPTPAGSPEQAAVVNDLVARLGAHGPACTVLLADRGRGKSAALGLAASRGQGRVVLTGPSASAVAEVTRFGGLPWTDPRELLDGTDADVILVDEAAQLPVPVLERLVRANPRANLALATTTHGYEGTGRGFVLRFLRWLDDGSRDLVRLTLREPIRWSAGDPLEALVRDVLLLDAHPAALPPIAGPTHHAVLNRDTLARDERLLAEVVGLLVHAHYRTTPGDVHRLLDAPNLTLHVLFEGPHAVAVGLLAAEGALPAATCAAIATGRGRIRGHALPDTLLSHAGAPPAVGTWPVVRSVRTAVHPDRQGLGLGTQLVRAEHACTDAELVGTVFSATAPVVRFRQRLGYEVVRVGLARSSRSGEPAVVMVHARSERARALVADLRAELSRDLEEQLQLLAADGGLPLDPALAEALRHDLPPPTPRSHAAALAIARAYAYGPRPLDASTSALRQVLDLSGGGAAGTALRGRLLERRSWAELVRAGDLDSVPAAMRAVRRLVASRLEPGWLSAPPGPAARPR